MTTKWNKDKIINSIRLFVNEHGRTPQSREFDNSKGKYPSRETIRRHFGSWNLALEESNIKTIKKRWTKSEIIESIIQFYNEKGEVPKTRDFNKTNKYPHNDTVETCFGSWSLALEAAGFNVKTKNWSKESIIEAIQLFVEENEKIPENRDFDDADGKYPSRTTVVRYFGSWNSAIEASGFQQKIWTKNSIIESIQLFVEKHGKIPQTRDFENSDGKYPSRRTIVNKFGSWNKAIEASGLNPDCNDGFGVRTQGKDGHLYRSKAEAYFADTFLFGQYEYEVEPKYPEPHYKWYDWYISELDCYIELDGGLRPHVIQEKIEINKDLGRTLLVISTKDIYKKDFNLIKIYITELKNKEYALVGANVVKINSIDVEDDDIQATSLFNEQTVSYSIKHSGMIPLTVEEKDKLVSTYNNEGSVGLLAYIYNNY